MYTGTRRAPCHIDALETNMQHYEYEFTVVLEHDGDGRFVAICPSLAGCYTAGETEAEACALIADAIRLHVEHRLEAGERIPVEVGAEKVRVGA